MHKSLNSFQKIKPFNLKKEENYESHEEGSWQTYIGILICKIGSKSHMVSFSLFLLTKTWNHVEIINHIMKAYV
jgi:hypothetical protein